jgi:hypothetical protein
VNEEDGGGIYVQVSCPECHGTGMIEELIRTRTMTHCLEHEDGPLTHKWRAFTL